MSYRTLCITMTMALAVATVSAQTKATLSGKCNKPDVEHSISIPDQQGHTFSLTQGKCSAMGDVNGVAAKDGVFNEQLDVMGNHFRQVAGVFVETFANGDKVFYDYQGAGTMKDGKFESGSNKYRISGGTGKMKGIKGSGTCKLTAASDGSSDYSCTSEYTMGGAAAKP